VAAIMIVKFERLIGIQQGFGLVVNVMLEVVLVTHVSPMCGCRRLLFWRNA
jgi:hypothetical protein